MMACPSCRAISGYRSSEAMAVMVIAPRKSKDGISSAR